ncbi:MAG: hypothetical protein L0H79_07040 [Intrasporangium sp.]|uniref:hypothetical protein n=1 Tax=Intrasporangium sp. TaxID=1925024 RepID=UPI00264A2569|nr:hypothetical protein [Intrasporangium sp.]MDN5795493.1 hypothetical protein [Intrasporangium sp.]
MELNPFWAALVRRWYLTIAGVVIAVALTALVVVEMGPSYKAEGAMLLFPPTETTKSQTQLETQGNPYLNLGGLTQARDVLIRALNAQNALEQFAEKAPTASYALAPDYTTSGPLIVIDVKAPTPTAALDGLQTMMTMIPGTLKALQSGLDIEQSAYITAIKLTADSRPEIVRSSQLRTGILAGAVSVALMLFLVGLIDGLLAARSATGASGARHGSRRRSKRDRTPGALARPKPTQPDPRSDAPSPEPDPDLPVVKRRPAPPSATGTPARPPGAPTGIQQGASGASSRSSEAAPVEGERPAALDKHEPMLTT